jgi:glycosyltransferase involved in cell wall biosynthesis
MASGIASMTPNPEKKANHMRLVSVVIPFYNTPPRFLEEAILSVFAQTYRNWELFLVDDGSVGPSSELALAWSERHPERVHYLEHPEHANRGTSASRNLGIKHGKGAYAAFLDSDDVWLPRKLEAAVHILEKNPEAGMVYGNTKYWYGWTGKFKDEQLDFTPRLGVEPDRSYQPPFLLPLFLEGKAAVPCPTSLLVRMTVLEQIGGFEESFTTPDEDQAFYAKVCLSVGIFVSGDCHELYRQHPSSVVAVARQEGTVDESRGMFLRWLHGYLIRTQVTDIGVWRELRRESWRIGPTSRFFPGKRMPLLVRRVRKWILKAEARLLPEPIRNRLWTNVPSGF